MKSTSILIYFKNLFCKALCLVYALSCVVMSATPQQRSFETDRLHNDCFAGTLLSQKALKTRVSCQLQCLTTKSCRYVVINQTSNLCAFYTAGEILYSANGLQVYSVKKTVEHVSFILLGQLHSEHSLS